ncbi:uncharacterized protein LOC132263566 isoform X2 [Phlebotomus argentipes]|uniref:uncharacterized protein LOC132263566 isoform X2 n=1 Tax=Phlebotomus argentipes TaxID=94469 RepID=UPI0028933A53|nr:uncharacterized protein LOC132263566 isoform X2 [Phlebotomus argentipes]
MSDKDEVDRVAAEKGAPENGGVVAPDVITSSARGVETSPEARDSAPRAATKSHWVKFDDPEEADKATEDASPHPLAPPRPAAVLTTETVHVNVSTSSSPTRSSGPAERNHQAGKLPSVAVIDVPSSRTADAAGMRTIELSTGRIREGFANGDIIVTLLPVNTKWPWVTPALFRPELVPEELMAQGLTLTVEEYVHAMETLVNDYRFTLYNICYKRVLVCWILFAFAVLLGLLFSGLTGITLFVLGVAWLFLNAAAIFLCMWIKLRLSRGLEKCLALVNKQLLRHKILLALDDRGKISCHKVNLCFLYFDSSQCISYLNDFIARHEQSGNAVPPGWESRMDLGAADIVIQGSTTTRVSRKQTVGEELFLRYLQRWGKDFLRRRLDWILEENGLNGSPRHLQVAICPCQYAEEIVLNKPRRDPRQCCACITNWFTSRGINCC